MLVKMPLGTWVIVVLAVFLTLWHGRSAIDLTQRRRGAKEDKENLTQRREGAKEDGPLTHPDPRRVDAAPLANDKWRHELMILGPMLGYLILVSAETGFNHHLRYVLGVFPFLFIWASRVAAPVFWRLWWVKGVTVAALLWVLIADIRVAPHFLSYFNELAGGPENGAKHLLDSNIDWGQDLIFLKKWMDAHPEARPLHVAWFHLFEPALIYPEMTSGRDLNWASAPCPGWFAVSVNMMHGYSVAGIQSGPQTAYTYFRKLTPVGRAGYSIYIFHVTAEDANRLRHKMGLPEWGKEDGR